MTYRELAIASPYDLLVRAPTGLPLIVASEWGAHWGTVADWLASLRWRRDPEHQLQVLRDERFAQGAVVIDLAEFDRQLEELRAVGSPLLEPEPRRRTHGAPLAR